MRGTPLNTRSTYRRCIERYERHFDKPAVQLGRAQVRQLLLYLIEHEKLSPSTHNVYAAALHFLHARARPTARGRRAAAAWGFASAKSAACTSVTWTARPASCAPAMLARAYGVYFRSMSEKRIVNLPELVVTAPRPLRPELLRFSWRSMTSPPVTKDTWATSTLLVRVELRKTSLVLVGCFQAYGDENGSQTERVIGPFRSEGSATAARDAVETALALPRIPQRVTARELQTDPARFDGMVVETTGAWSKGFERSSFAGAWLVGPLGSGASAGVAAAVQVRACGFWHCKDDEHDGYGHLGASRAELLAYEVAPLPPKPETIAKVQLDGVLVTFEQNGDYDEWRAVSAGVPLPMLFKETDETRPEAARRATHVPVDWLPLDVFLGFREHFAIYRSPEGTRAVGSHRNKPVDIQGTACYSGETLTLMLEGSGRVVRVTLHHDFDSSA